MLSLFSFTNQNPNLDKRESSSNRRKDYAVKNVAEALQTETARYKLSVAWEAKTEIPVENDSGLYYCPWTRYFSAAIGTTSTMRYGIWPTIKNSTGRCRSRSSRKTSLTRCTASYTLMV